MTRQQWQWVGQNIGRYRRERKLSQWELATLVGVARQTVSRWETGQCLPERKHLVTLTKLLKVPLHALFARPGAPAPMGPEVEQAEMGIDEGDDADDAEVVAVAG